MYIKSITLDGFKSYRHRTEIDGFDREFNAISGHNGSGKSNILDAICFVLGVSKLDQVRAKGLQDLIYKNGNAGINKASVSVTFVNQDEDNVVMPLGYEHCEEITVKRQISLDGKNRYFVNGKTVTNQHVMDMFSSVQLNVNSPHFLVMQGQITKVLRMRPQELLTMIEEAIGTSIYDRKKMSCHKTLAKKDRKLEELNDYISNDVTPRMERLRQEFSHYQDFKRLEKESEDLRKLFLAYKYHDARNICEITAETADGIKQSIARNQNRLEEGRSEVERLGKIIDENYSKVQNEMGGTIRDLQSLLTEKETILMNLTVKLKSDMETLEAERRHLLQLHECCREEEDALRKRESDTSKANREFLTLKEAEMADAEALAAAQKRYQEVSAGLICSDDGIAVTLQDQLIRTRQVVSETETKMKQCEMELAYNERELTSKEIALGLCSTDHVRNRAALEQLGKEIAHLDDELNKLQYEEGALEKLEDVQRELGINIRRESLRVQTLQAKYPALTFKYKDPEPQFDRSRVKGLVCRLFKVREAKYERAIEEVAGAKLYYVIVDNEMTSKAILQNGQLSRRVTVIPLNRINSNTAAIDNQTVRFAKQLTGDDKVFPAIDVIEFDPAVERAMKWIFGHSFVCVDSQSARTIAYHKDIMKLCVTFDGDVFNPSGTMSGGAVVRSEPILHVLHDLMTASKFLSIKERELASTEGKIKTLTRTERSFSDICNKKNQKVREAELLKKATEQSEEHHLRVEADKIRQTVSELDAKIREFKIVIVEGKKKASVLESNIQNSSGVRERELKKAKEDMDRLKMKAEKSSKNWKKREDQYEQFKIEIQALVIAQEASKGQIVEMQDLLNKLEESIAAQRKNVDFASEEVQRVKHQISVTKEKAAKDNTDIEAAESRRHKIKRAINQWELDIQKEKHNMQKLQTRTKEKERLIADLENENDWIREEQTHFGKEGGFYDFSGFDFNKTAERIAKIEGELKRLRTNLKPSVVRHINQLEKQVEKTNQEILCTQADRVEIQGTIADLDGGKKKRVEAACEEISVKFCSIFSGFLPGATAKLEPSKTASNTTGLQIRVAFGNTWKDDLSELSGGQRSLIGLSLILAMLQFNPAPIYILDEIDAALDEAHTRNIGQTLKKHFRQSQFLVVSLKKGMFSKANVLFQCSFADGVSKVTRTSVANEVNTAKCSKNRTRQGF